MNEVDRQIGPAPNIAPRNTWLDMVFSSKSARSGGVVRRNVRWVEREIGRETLIAEVQSRGFHMIETGCQFIIICNRGGLSMIC